MPIKPLTSKQIDELVGTNHPTTGIEYPPDGLQPYYQWLVRTLHLLAEASAGALRVARDADEPTAVQVAPGRASIDGAAVAYEGETIELQAHNNDTAYLALIEDDGAAKVQVASAGDGWPGDPHVKLAEVSLNAGRITDVLDRRFETIFRV